MPRRGGRHYVVLKGAEDAIEAFRARVARRLGLYDKVSQVGWEGLTTQEVGQIGGEMVKLIMAAGELAIKQNYEQRGEAWLTDFDNIKMEDLQQATWRTSTRRASSIAPTPISPEAPSLH